MLLPFSSAEEWRLEWSLSQNQWLTGIEKECTLLSLNMVEFPTAKLPNNLVDFQVELGQAAPLDNHAGWAIPCLLRPLKSGNLSLPSIELQSQGKTLASPTTSIVVEDPLLSSNIHLEVQLNKTQLYVGEWAELKVIWTSNILLQDFKALNLLIPIMGDRDIRLLDPIDAIDPDNKKSIGLPVSHRRVIGLLNSRQEGEELEYKIEFCLLVQALKAKTYSFPPSTLFVSQEVVERSKNARNKLINRYPSYFNNNFFDAEQFTKNSQRIYCLSKPFSLEVLDLPKENQPKAYSGLINIKNISLTSSSNTVSSRHPLQVSLEIQHDYPNGLTIPTLSEFPAVQRLFNIPKDRSPAELSQGKALVRQSLWPLSPDINFFPSLEIISFNTSLKTYETFKTDSFTFSRGEELDNTSATLGDFGVKVNLKSRPEDLDTGIWHSRWEITPKSQTWTPALKLSLAILGPLFLFILALSPQICRKFQQMADARPSAAYRRFAKKWQEPQWSDQDKFEQLQNHLQYRLQLKVKDSKKIRENLQQKIPADIFASLWSIFQQLEKNAYSAQAKTPFEPLKALAIIERGDRCLR
jgi:hypothetical protein